MDPEAEVTYADLKFLPRSQQTDVKKAGNSPPQKDPDRCFSGGSPSEGLGISTSPCVTCYIKGPNPTGPCRLKRLGSIPGSATVLLDDLRQVPLPLSASVSPATLCLFWLFRLEALQARDCLSQCACKVPITMGPKASGWGGWSLDST